MLYNTSPDQLYEPRSAVDPVGFGHVAIVTGCASGIGLACTQLLLAHQFAVVGLDRNAFDYALLRESDHGRFHFHQCDLTQDGACDNAVRIARHSSGGRIDALINVAGVLDNFASADTLSDRQWDDVLAVNLTVPVKMMRSVIQAMRTPAAGKAPGGAIINVSSTAGVSGAVAGIAYTASKHGLIGATKNVAWRFRNEGIRCNAVLPGAVDSSIGQAIAGRMAEGLDAGGFAELAPVHALQARRAPAAPGVPPSDTSSVTGSSSSGATPATATDITALEVAKAILFLLSDQARSINGVCLPVDKAWGVM